ncbi:glycosyltransferase family 39 protein [bacterium]|nr:glycosyltransferase family 39 protein [bacterium]
MPQITYIDTEAPTPRERRSFWRLLLRLTVRYRVAILAFMAVYRFVGLSFGEMQQWDESIYALRVQDILRFGDIWDQSPHMLSGLYYAVHPPLYVWLSTSLVLLTTDALWVYRLTSAIAAALLIPLVYRIARSSAPAGRALVTTGLFAFAPLPTFYSRQGQLDMLLALGMLAALYFAWRSVQSRRAGDTWLAGLTLGVALLTKFGFALSIPAAVALTTLLETPARRLRTLRVAVLMTIISLPLWVPWFWAMTARHGNGNVFWLFDPALPLGATITGAEGTAKDTGMMFYLNQLVVHFGLLFPFAVVGLLDGLRRESRGMLSWASVFTLLLFVVLLFLKSSFTVYLLPAFPLLFLLAVHGFGLVKRMSNIGATSIAIFAVFCLAWSLFPEGRVAVKQLYTLVLAGNIPGDTLTALLLMAGTTIALLLGVLILVRRRRLRSWLTLPLLYTVAVIIAVTTMYRIWFVDPAKFVDGAQDTVYALETLEADHVLLVGNGDNPQLTWYLGGADIGWVEGEGQRFFRLEPEAMGVDGIRSRAERFADTSRVAMIIEKDEITSGVYRSAQDVMPSNFRIYFETRRYVIAGESELQPNE